VPGGGTYTWEYRLIYTDAQGGEVPVRTLPTHTPRFGLCCCSGSRQTEPWGQARACGSSGGGSEGSGLWEGEMEWWAELQQRVNLYSTREVTPPPPRARPQRAAASSSSPHTYTTTPSPSLRPSFVAAEP